MTSSKYRWKHWTVSFPIYLWMFCSLWHLNRKLLIRYFCIFSCSLHCLWKENPEGHAERVLMTNWCVMDMKSILWLLVVFKKIFLMGVLLHVSAQYISHSFIIFKSVQHFCACGGFISPSLCRWHCCQRNQLMAGDIWRTLNVIGVCLLMYWSKFSGSYVKK